MATTAVCVVAIFVAGIGVSGWMLVEEFPVDTPVEAEFAAGIVGQYEVVGAGLPECVEVTGFEVDACAFHLQVDEYVAPQVAAHADFVLLQEETCLRAVERCVVGCVITHVNTCLCPQGAVEEREVGVE